jgi:hypothetical protein
MRKRGRKTGRLHSLSMLVLTTGIEFRRLTKVLVAFGFVDRIT